MTYSDLIKPDLITQQIELMHAHCARLGLADAGQMPLCAFHPISGKSRIARFAIGEAKRMAGTAAQWAKELNVYVPVHLMRPDLPPGKRGKADDITAVFGAVIDADSDKDSGHTPPDIAPTFTLITSRIPTLNRQLFWLLDEAVERDRALQLMRLLYRKCGGDHGTKDVAHVWRIAGTLNFPNQAKIKRGRPQEPQPIEVAQ
jgi:hypothetical protein